MPRFFSPFLVLALLGLHLVAQEPTLRSRVNLVPVPTMVRDANGNAIYGLDAQDFVIKDDGVEQPIRLDETPEDQPMSLLIAVQCGRRAQREFSRMAGLAAMLDPVLTSRNNEADLILFDSRLNLVQDFTAQGDAVEAALKNLQPGDNGAAILDAVAYAAKLLGKRPAGRQRVLLLISETRDHGSHFAKIDDVVRLLGISDIRVFTLSFSPYVSQQLDTLRGSNSDEGRATFDIIEKLAAVRQAMKRNTPETLASMTGGEHKPFTSRRGFETDMTTFSNHLKPVCLELYAQGPPSWTA